MNINGKWVGTDKPLELIAGQVPVLQRQIHGQRRLPPLEGGNHGVVLLDGEADLEAKDVVSPACHRRGRHTDLVFSKKA